MKDLTDITVVLDRSGSMGMGTMREDTIEGFNNFLKDQQKEKGDAVISLVQFDTEYEPAYSNTDIQKCKMLDEDTFIPRGATALYDTWARTIKETGNRFKSMKEKDRPDKVVFVVITDGKENASTDTTAKKLGEIIKEQEIKYNWQFMFLGANQDAILSAKAFGLGASRAVTYDANTESVGSTYKVASNKLRSYRQGGVAASLDFTDDDREEITGKKTTSSK